MERPSVALLPPTFIKSVEIIFPSKFKWMITRNSFFCLTFFWNIFPKFNKIILSMPWHACFCESIMPFFKAWDPEVHHQMLLSFLQEPYILSVSNSSDLLSIVKPCNIIWSPLEFVKMPIILRIGNSMIKYPMILFYVLPDYVCTVSPILRRRNQLNINLAPTTVVPGLLSITFPESEERSACTFLIYSFNSCLEFTIFVCLPCHDFSRHPVQTADIPLHL